MRSRGPVAQEDLPGVPYVSAQGYVLHIPRSMVRIGAPTDLTIGRVTLRLDHKRRQIVGEVPEAWLVELGAVRSA
jgi:hypothetical protein